MNTAISEMLMVRTVKPISCAPFSAACERVHALFQIARDVLDHHDGVVHHEAGGDGQRHQRQVVDAEAEQVHHAEGADQRDRHGDAGNERGRGLAQEDEHHQDHQNTEISSVLSVSCTEARMVTVWSIATRISMARGMAACKLRQSGANAVDGVDDVGAGLAEDDHQHRRLAVGVAGIAQVFHRIHRVPTSQTRTAAPL